MNYLIFPGTSGAFWIDYLICDKYVVPPDHSPRRHFTEKLVLLPHSYQVNYYDRHLAKLRETNLNLRKQVTAMRRGSRQAIGGGIEISVTSTSTSTSSNDKKPAKRILVGAEAVKARAAEAAKASSEALLVAGGGSAEDTAAAVVRLLRARNRLVWPSSNKKAGRRGGGFVSIGGASSSGYGGGSISNPGGTMSSSSSFSSFSSFSSSNSGGRINIDVLGSAPPPHLTPVAPLPSAPEASSPEATLDDDGTPPPFVFVNFNKNDKLEPLSFGLWLNILRRTTEERSLLWLLRPSQKLATNSIEDNLRAVAAASGVDPKRLVFADRAPKHEHLARHVAGDLFLDTFFYGAHSTATDALRGGLPVITCPGDAFARRVGVSLLENAYRHRQRAKSEDGVQRALLTHSLSEFEDVAVRIAKDHHASYRRRHSKQQTSAGKETAGGRSGGSLLDALRRDLATSTLNAAQKDVNEGRGVVEAEEAGGGARDDHRLFDTQEFTVSVERAYAVMWEVYSADKAPRGIQQPADDGSAPLTTRRHIVVGG